MSERKIEKQNKLDINHEKKFSVALSDESSHCLTIAVLRQQWNVMNVRWAEVCFENVPLLLQHDFAADEQEKRLHGLAKTNW